MSPEAFHAALAALGMSQARLSRILGVNKVTPCRWSTGAVEIPRAVELLLQAWLAHPRLIRDLTP